MESSGRTTPLFNRRLPTERKTVGGICCNRIILLMAMLLPAAVPAAPPQQRITGIYSDLSYNEEGGDLLGMELLIVPSGSGPGLAYSAFVQIAEGGAPYVALVPLKVSGKQIEFTLPANEPYGGLRFVGTVNNSGISIRSDHGEAEQLKRGRSYWE